MSKIDRPAFGVDLEGAHSADYIWKLHRVDDGLVRTSYEVTWIEWDETGKFKQRNDEPVVGRSLLMSPFNIFFTWQTTPVKEIIHTELKDDKLISVKFKTSNSTYELEYVPNPHINEGKD
jgi:hypothetical protein